MLKIFWIVGLLWGTASYANGVQDLDWFLSKSSSISANFKQTILVSGKAKTVSGHMEISRPNKFRWQYPEDEQLIVSDGVNIYIYDKPLQQVTQRKLEVSIGASPAVILAGGTDMKKHYVIVAESNSGGLEWVSLTPKNNQENNGFKLVKIGFVPVTRMLSKMSFVDDFNNCSTIEFNDVILGSKLSQNDFKFTAPDGVDILKAD